MQTQKPTKIASTKYKHPIRL